MRLHRFFLPAAGLLLALASTGCSSNDTSGPDETHHPAWLTGQLTAHNTTTTGQMQVENIELKEDGRAIDSWRSVEIDLPSLGPSDSSRYVDWSLDGSILRVDARKQQMYVAANCHLVQLDDRVFKHGNDEPVAGCPQVEAPLTETEAAFVGFWSYSAWSDDWSDEYYVSVWLDANRRLSMTVGSITAAPIETAFSITDDGTLEAHGPDGTATLAAKVTITSRGRLRWCEGSHCLDLKP